MMEVYDIECFSNVFVYCGLDVETLKEHIFVICESRNDIANLLGHIHGKTLIGYNNLNYDSQVIQHLINTGDSLFDLKGDQIARLIYRKSQFVIENSNMGAYPSIPEWQLSNSQIDLFRIWHFDNKNRGTRLKDLQVALKWKRVKESSLAFYNDHWEQREIDEIVDYCLNDIRSTHAFYLRSLEQIDLRKKLSKQFNLMLMNANDPKLGGEIFAKLISERSNIPKKDLKKLRTQRTSINLGEVVLNYIHFNDNTLNMVLNQIRRTTIVNTKGDFKYNFKFGGIPFDLRLGGIHACTAPGRYKAVNGKVIKDIDVKSFYPNLAIKNRFRPEHLPEVYCDIYEEIFNERDTIPKSDPCNYAYKIMLNGVYGKSNEDTSFFYDPRYTMQITINGQLLILMLAEKLVEVGEIQILQANTDGITIMYGEDKEEKIEAVCRQWMALTSLSLEYCYYSEMCIRDVNNYLAIGTDNKVKCKGAYEVFDITKKDFKDWHKDPSFPIVGKAVYEYFVNGTDIKKTIDSCKDVLDFCGRAKFRSDSHGEIRGYISFNDELIQFTEHQQKTTRYYISNKGERLVKVFENGRESVFHGNNVITIYNNHTDNHRPDINKDFYYQEANKLIDGIEGDKKQLSLW